MQIFKPSLVVCAAALAIMPFSLQAADTEAQIRAREALEKKLSEMPPQEPAPPAKAPGKPKKTPAQPAAKKQAPPPVQPASDQPAPPPVVEATPPPPPPSRASSKGDRVATKKAYREPKAQPQPKPVVGRTAQPTFNRMDGPALPISADKQQRLATLLQQYQADQLTPAQYHEARAK